jgi:hypothetical protein
MLQFAKVDFDTALLTKTTLMFSDLIKLLKEDQSIKATRRRDMISGLHHVAKALGCAP